VCFAILAPPPVIKKDESPLHALPCFASCHCIDYMTSQREGHYNLKKCPLLLWVVSIHWIDIKVVSL